MLPVIQQYKKYFDSNKILISPPGELSGAGRAPLELGSHAPL